MPPKRVKRMGKTADRWRSGSHSSNSHGPALQDPSCQSASIEQPSWLPVLEDLPKGADPQGPVGRNAIDSVRFGMQWPPR